MTNVGTRVWVVRDATDEVVNAYGFGTYIGDHLMPGWNHPATLARCEKSIRRSDIRPLFDPTAFYDRKVADGEMTREKADAIVARGKAAAVADRARPMADRVLDLARSCGMNPRIELDSGGWVWGAECWWGDADEDTPAAWAKGRRIVTVPAPEREVVR